MIWRSSLWLGCNMVIEGQRLPRKVFRRSIALLSDSLSTLRSADYSSTTQDSLPVAGQALLDGLSTRRVPLKGFKVVDYISFPFPKLSWRNRCDRRDLNQSVFRSLLVLGLRENGCQGNISGLFARILETKFSYLFATSKHSVVRPRELERPLIEDPRCKTVLVN